MTLTLSIILSFIVGLGIGLLVHFLRVRSFEAEKKAEVDAQRGQFDDAIKNLQMTFKGISSEVLKESREEFLKQAEPKIGEHIRPLKDLLTRYELALNTIENKREEAYGSLSKYLDLLKDGQTQLTKETATLVTALRSPTARGRWGELTLKRVVEVAGMSEFCDFDEQVSVSQENGKQQRPDMVVRLPGDRTVVVDAKTPIDSYLDAMETSDDVIRNAKLANHAQKLRDHMRALGQKSYWQQFDNTPDFVVLFIPGESYFSAALEQDRTLIEDGIKNKVVLATPTTLIVLLRSVAMGWQQENLAKNSQMISDAGKDLFERLSTFASHISKVGVNLSRAVGSYNDAVGSWESRLVPGARKLKELGATKSTSAVLPEIDKLDHIPKELSAVEE